MDHLKANKDTYILVKLQEFVVNVLLFFTKIALRIIEEKEISYLYYTVSINRYYYKLKINLIKNHFNIRYIYIK